MPGPRKRGVTFIDRWPADERLKRWLKKVRGGSTKALCIFCNNKKIDIVNMRISALEKHSDKEKVYLLSSMLVCSSQRRFQQLPANQLCCPQAIHMMSQTRLKYLYLW